MVEIVKPARVISALLIATSPSVFGNVQAAAQPAQQAPASGAVNLVIPAKETMIILIRSAVIALGHANMTNNYAVLNGLGAQAFRGANPPQKLAETFASFRTSRTDLSPVLLLTPELTVQPVLSGGVLRLSGRFPSQPMQVNFDLAFQGEQGVWKLAGLNVNLTSVARPPN